MNTDPHRFGAWRSMLAIMPDAESRLETFQNATVDLAGQVAEGRLEKPDAVDELLDQARAFNLLDDVGQDRLEEIIGDEFRRIESKPNGSEPKSKTASLDEWDAGDDPGPIAPRQWLLGNQFCVGFISSIVSAGGRGKSALRLLQYVSLALGRSLCGQHVFRRCRVLLVSLEDDGAELQRRIAAILIHYKIDRAELSGWLFCATPKMAKIAIMNGKTRVVGPLEQQLRDAIARRKPDIVSLDPFVKLHALEENASGDMDFVADLLASLAVEFDLRWIVRIMCTRVRWRPATPTPGADRAASATPAG